MKQKQRKRILSVLLSAVILLSPTVLPAKAADAKTNIKIGDYIRLGHIIMSLSCGVALLLTTTVR